MTEESRYSGILLNREPPDDYIQRWKVLIKGYNKDFDFESQSVLVFRLSKYWLAWPLNHVKTVTEVKVIKKIPHRNEDILMGTIKQQGSFHLVFALDHLLKIRGVENFGEETQSFGRRSYPCMIFADYKKQTIVFPVNDVVGVYYLMNSSLEPSHAGKVGKTVCSHAKGFFEYRQKSVALLDEALVFNAFEDFL